MTSLEWKKNSKVYSHHYMAKNNTDTFERHIYSLTKTLHIFIETTEFITITCFNDELVVLFSHESTRFEGQQGIWRKSKQTPKRQRKTLLVQKLKVVTPLHLIQKYFFHKTVRVSCFLGKKWTIQTQMTQFQTIFIRLISIQEESNWTRNLE